MLTLVVPIALLAGIQSCGDTKYPSELPAPSTLIDSARVMADLAPFGGSSRPMVFSLVFDAGDSLPRVRALGKKDEAVAVSLARYVRPQRPAQLWAIRVRIAGGNAPTLTLARATYCPPAPRSQIVPPAAMGFTRNPRLPTPLEMQPGAQFEALVDLTGLVRDAHVLRASGITGADETTLSRIRRHRFYAARLDGEYVEGVWRSHGEVPRP